MQNDQTDERNARAGFIRYTKADDKKSRGKYRREPKYDIKQ